MTRSYQVALSVYVVTEVIPATTLIFALRVWFHFLSFFLLLCFFFALLCFALLCFALLCFALLCFALLCFALLCFALLCFALLCFVLFCFVLFCFVLSFPIIYLLIYLFQPLSRTLGKRRPSRGEEPLKRLPPTSSSSQAEPSSPPSSPPSSLSPYAAVSSNMDESSS